MEKKKVLLVGDSIRQGYGRYVKEHLQEQCEVYYPSENCRFSQYVLRHLSDWKNSLQLSDELDLIHWNAGLWDTLEQYGDGCLTPPEFYAYFIEKICNRIQLLFPRAKVIFATSTPVLEERFSKNFCRKNANIEKYNEIAIEICQRYGVAVNDLYAVAQKMPESFYKDAVHPYTPGGTQVLTDAVCRAICDSLGIPYTPFTLKEYEEICEVIGV